MSKAVGSTAVDLTLGAGFTRTWLERCGQISLELSSVEHYIEPLMQFEQFRASCA